DAVQLTSGDVQVSRDRGTDSQNDGVITLTQLPAGQVTTDVDTVAEPRALGLHLGEATVQDGLLHLELRDAVSQQAAGLVGSLENGDGVSCPGQLLGNGQPGGPGPDNRNGLASQAIRCPWRDRSGVEGAVDRGDLDLFDGHGRLVDAEHASGLTRRRAQPTGELREVVR